MAEYNPTTFAEFLTAISDNDTTKVVNCPQNAEWDASELEPEGHTGMLKLYGTINGNGTKIKNLVIRTSTTPIFKVNGTTTDLHFVDGVWNCGTVVQFGANNSMLQLCTFSASVQNATSLFSDSLTAASGFSTKYYVYRCAVNIEVSVTSGTFYVQHYQVVGDYNNIKISSSTVTGIILTFANGSYPNSKATNSAFTLDTPMITTLQGIATWSLIRCSGANVTSPSVSASSGFSLGCSTDFPNAQGTSTFVLCTEPQLRDAAYLQSIGFPIGV